MRFRTVKFALLGLAVMLALHGVRAGAQTSVESDIPGAGFDTPDSDAPTIEVYSREVIVDVTVTDDNGNPVRGLQASDFHIEENNKPQGIRSFEEFGEKAPGVVVPQKLQPHVYSNTDAMPANGPVNIILLDVMHTVPDVMEQAKQQVSDYLKSMPLGTQIAVFDLSPSKGLLLIQGFTTDGERAAVTVDAVDVEWNRNPPKADMIASLNVIAAYVSGIHGRKNLLWFVPGMPAMLVRDGGYAWSPPGIISRNTPAPDMSIVHRLMDTYERFTAEQVAVSPVDPRGVVPVHGMAQLKVNDVAEQSGGEAFYSSNDLKASIAKAINDGSNFYSLSYIPPRQKDDGHFHTIKITTTRPGLHLVYRKGYNSEQPVPVTPASHLQMTQNSMGLGALPSTQLTFDVQIEPSALSPAALAKAAKASAGRHALPNGGKTPVSYDLLYKLQQSQITFAVSKDGTRNASLEFDLAVYNSDGKLLTVRSQTLKLPLNPAEYLDFIETPFKFFLPIDLPPGQVTLRVGVFDGMSNKAGTVEIPLNVTKDSAQSTAALH